MEKSKNDVRRLEIAGLYVLSYLGYMNHSILHNLLAHGMDPKILAETAEMMNQAGMQIMMFVWSVLTVAPAFMAFLVKGKTGWKILSILAAVVLLLNGVHSVLHMAQGDVFNGGTTFVLQMIPGILALVWSFKLTKSLT